MNRKPFEVNVRRAADVPGREPVHDLVIRAETPASIEDRRQQSNADAFLLSEALHHCLPQGTLDRLLPLLMQRRASDLLYPSGRPRPRQNLLGTQRAACTGLDGHEWCYVWKLREGDDVHVYLDYAHAPSHEDYRLAAVLSFVMGGTLFSVETVGVRELRGLAKFLNEFADRMEAAQLEKPSVTEPQEA